MNEIDAWNCFLQTGHVDDYLVYLSIQRAKEFGENPEAYYENSNRRDNSERTEFR